MPPGAARRPRRAVRSARVAVRYLALAPGTHVLLLIIIVTTLVLRGVDAPTATRILRHQSTNIIRMSREAPRVLLLSAFLLDGGSLLREAVIFTLVLVPVERWIGTYRWIATFAAGHIGATLATTIGIWLQVRQGGTAAGGLVYPVDVGVSYGVAAIAAILVFRLPRPASWLWLALMGALLGRAVIGTGTFTDWGHLAAFVIGLALGPIVRPRDDPGEVAPGAVRAAGEPVGGPGPEPARFDAPRLVFDPPVGRPARHRGPSVLTSRLGAALHWLTTPPRRRLRDRRHALRLLGAGLLLGAAALGGAVVFSPGRGIAVPDPGRVVRVTVLGRPPGCSRTCRSVVVRYRTDGTDESAVLLLPQDTLTRPGDRLAAIVDPATPGHLRPLEPPQRVHPEAFLGALAAAAAAAGLALVLLPRPEPPGG